MDTEFINAHKDSKSEIVRFLDSNDSTEDIEVLLIDFELATIRLLDKYFESKGHTCKGVLYGESGLYLLRNFLKPKVVLINIYLEDMMGNDLCRIIKSDHDLKNILVIYLTTHILNEEMTKKIKADGYIHLPFHFSDFDGIFDLLNMQKNKNESTKNSKRRSFTDEEMEERRKRIKKLYEEERREEERRKVKKRKEEIAELKRKTKEEVLHPSIPPPYSSEIKNSKVIYRRIPPEPPLKLKNRFQFFLQDIKRITHTFWRKLKEFKIIKNKTRCNICFKRIPRGKTPLTKTTCPSCASSLESGFWKGIIRGLPLEEHGIERWHLNEIWKYPEIVSELVKILRMDIQDLQEDKLSVTLTVLELIDQIEDKEIRNSANRLFQFFLER
jgi:DNA-binding response OmpR family regulator